MLRLAQMNANQAREKRTKAGEKAKKKNIQPKRKNYGEKKFMGVEFKSMLLAHNFVCIGWRMRAHFQMNKVSRYGMKRVSKNK